MVWPDAEMLLAGPRGRLLCASLLDPGDSPERHRVWHGRNVGDLTGLTHDIAACVARTDLGAIASRSDELALVGVLAETVDTAMYWQEPDDQDRALDDRAIRDALMPVAQAVAGAPAARWWATPTAIGCQQYVEWLSPGTGPPLITGATAELASWRAALMDEEQQARRLPKDLTASITGHWWSTPVHSRLPSTTRSVPGIGAVRLALVEDGLGWTEARCWPVEPRTSARIFEVSGATDWTELVAKYPIDVTNCRRHDWWRATGRDGRWLIPDYAAVAKDYDAVHVSVVGYLAAAGRALPVSGAATVLAGWEPDQAYWLTDVLKLAGPAANWVNLDREPLSWTLARPGAPPG